MFNLTSEKFKDDLIEILFELLDEKEKEQIILVKKDKRKEEIK